MRWRSAAPPYLLLAAAVLFNALTLLPELTVRVPSNNDDATHFALVQRTDDALSRGENILDPWFPELELGLPWFIYYQPAPAIAVVGVHRALFGLLDLLAVFNGIRYVLLVLLPLTVYWSLRRIGIGSFGAALAGASASLLSGDFRYGFEYDSYTWRGFGMFTQLAAMHLSFIFVATVWRALDRGRDLVRAALALTALVVTHLIYGYMAVGTAVLLVLSGFASFREIPRRAVRLSAILAMAGVLSAWLWLPFLQTRAYLGVSPYLQPEKFNSYGAPAVVGWLVSGDLLDHSRLPVLTLLLGAGLATTILTRTRIARTALILFAAWLVLYFGRPTLGTLVDLLPMHEGLLLHRFIGSVDLFAIVLIGIGADGALALARRFPARPRLAALVAAAALSLLLVPAAVERRAFHDQGAIWMRQTLAAIQGDADARTIIDALRARPAGRVYAGQRNRGYGPSLNFGLPFNSVRLSDVLIFNGLPVVASPYSSLSLNADLMWDFTENKAEHYDLFDVRYVVQPTGAAAPSFLVPLVRTQRYTLYQAYTSGYAGYASVIDDVSVTTQRRLFEINRPWFNGPDLANREIHRFAFPASIDTAAPVAPAVCARPSYPSETVLPGRIEASVRCDSASALVIKVTYHPNWTLTVDGRHVGTFMASPSFLGAMVPAGEHTVVAEYHPSAAKTPLFLLAVLVAIGLGASMRSHGRLGIRLPFA